MRGVRRPPFVNADTAIWRSNPSSPETHSRSTWTGTARAAARIGPPRAECSAGRVLQLHGHRAHRGGQGHGPGLLVHRARAGATRCCRRNDRQLEQHRPGLRLPGQGQRDRAAVAPDGQPQVVPVRGREVGQLDGLARRVSQEPGTPRPMIREPSDRCATSESSSTLLPLAMPQLCGAEPWPPPGWLPTHGEPGSGRARAFPPRRGSALGTVDHELVAEDPLVSVLVPAKPQLP